MDDPSEHGSSDWELLGLVDTATASSSSVAPLARPTNPVHPRISPKHQLVQNKPLSVPKSSPGVTTPRPSGEALERPEHPSARSSGPVRELKDLGIGSLPRPAPSNPIAASLNQPRLIDHIHSPPAPQIEPPSVNTWESKLPQSTHRPRKRVAPSSEQITRIKHTSDSLAIQSLLKPFLICYTCYSELLTRLQASAHGYEHLERILDGFSPNTILRYLNCLVSLVETCNNLHVDLSNLDDIGLADLLMTGATEAGKFSSMTLKAIRWAWKQFALSCFRECFSPVVSSFTKTKFITDRREALPLPLLVLVQWERRILQSASEVHEVLILGTFLVMLFSGMRFGDIQRVIMPRLQFDSRTLRGVSWKTKTCNSGVPFGILCSGFLSKGSHHWVFKFLSVLDAALEGEDPTKVDFLLPRFSGGQLCKPVEPMPYSEALYYLRSFMHLPWRSRPLVFDNSIHYTVHGLKSTFLSWASQLRLDPESRRLQGHHQDPLQSTRLYSRDDINGSLYVQESIITKVLEGWRPQTPLSRGGQLPLQEPVVTLESFKKAAPEQEWKFFAFNKPPEILVMPESDQDLEGSGDSTDSSSESSSSSSSLHGSQQSSKKPRSTTLPSQDGRAEEVDMGSYRNMLHVIMDWGATDTPEHHRRIRTACGRLFPACNITPLDEWSSHTGKSFCTHPGCRKGWVAVGVLS